MSDAEPQVPGWPKRGPLYGLLWNRLPAYRTQQNLLDVYGLAADLRLPGKSKPMSAAGVYKWIDKGWLSVDGAKALLAVADSEENREALDAVGGTPLTREDLLPFLFA